MRGPYLYVLPVSYGSKAKESSYRGSSLVQLLGAIIPPHPTHFHLCSDLLLTWHSERKPHSSTVRVESSLALQLYPLHLNSKDGGQKIQFCKSSGCVNKYSISVQEIWPGCCTVYICVYVCQRTDVVLVSNRQSKGFFLEYVYCYLIVGCVK